MSCNPLHKPRYMALLFQSGPERSALTKFVLQYHLRQDCESQEEEQAAEDLIWQHSSYHRSTVLS